MKEVLKAAHRLFDTNCRECGEVKVWFWKRHCAFCDEGEGAVETAHDTKEKP